MNKRMKKASVPYVSRLDEIRKSVFKGKCDMCEDDIQFLLTYLDLITKQRDEAKRTTGPQPGAQEKR